MNLLFFTIKKKEKLNEEYKPCKKILGIFQLKHDPYVCHCYTLRCFNCDMHFRENGFWDKQGETLG